MSDLLDTTIYIGGKISKKLADQLFDNINDDFSEIHEGPDSQDDFRNYKSKEPIKWSGMSDYGYLDTTTAFCRKHKLSYHHYCEAKYEYDGTVDYWAPEMNQIDSQGIYEDDFKDGYTLKASQQQDPLVLINDVKPFIDLLFACIKDEVPTMINDERIPKPLLEKLIRKDPDAILILKQIIDTHIVPTLPELPPFVIGTR